MKLVVRIINSFEFSTIFYTTVTVDKETKLSDVLEIIKKEVDTNMKFRPIRKNMQDFDCMRIYCYPGQNKTMNLTFNDKQGENININIHLSDTVEQLGFQNEMEISLFRLCQQQQWQVSQ